MPAPKRRLRRNLGDVIKNMTANNKVFLGEYVSIIDVYFSFVWKNIDYLMSKVNFNFQSRIN